ncbi:hypothetical protein [Streptomyces sp. Tue6028]|uniref:hypothetical protein n=1 Tax=Streptomyces sp. Tue6028 TaxID=2036037 RepID=UPI003D74D71E
MHDDSAPDGPVGFLLGLIEDEDAARVRRRIGRPQPAAPQATPGWKSLGAPRAHSSWWTQTPVPSSVLLWVLQEDDPELNALVWRHVSADDAMRRAIVHGIPHGPGRTHAVDVAEPLSRNDEPPVPRAFSLFGLVGALRAATAMKPARQAASMVLGTPGWQAVAGADAERPLPGYTRWALSVRPDCPPELRARFGSHARFTHRLRQSGVIDGPARYATEWRPADRVLRVLSLGRTLFPTRLGEAEDALRPLVRDRLGGREDAWAVLAQLVGNYHGTVPELVVMAGAIA